jgi:hypothetical protein
MSRDTDHRNSTKISRRKLLQSAAFTLGALGTGKLSKILPDPHRSIQETSKYYFPFIGKNAGAARVVHTQHAGATNWDFNTSHPYYEHLSQSAVDWMVDEGIKLLTGTGSRSAAWQSLIPNFVPGQKLAIKVNFNNYYDGSEGSSINALIEPVNSLIAGLIERGFTASNISVYDVTNAWHDGGMPTRFINGCDFPGVQFVYHLGNSNPYSSTECIQFARQLVDWPEDSDRLPLANVLVNADYLINMPIAKTHSFGGVTLGFKNHFGSFEHCDYTHEYLPGYEGGINYDPNYSPLVDINSNLHIRDKTVLVVGDCLFGSWEGVDATPSPWITFGYSAPNSLFFAADPVAADCVMIDILAAETSLIANTDRYLQLASAAGLGCYERGDPWGVGYNQIAYTKSIYS